MTPKKIFYYSLNCFCDYDFQNRKMNKKKWVLSDDNIEMPVAHRNEKKNVFIMLYIDSVIIILTTEKNE